MKSFHTIKLKGLSIQFLNLEIKIIK